MHLVKYLLLGTFPLLAFASDVDSAEPAAPGLTFLYTAYVDCLNRVYTHTGPRGICTAIPIVGGNFTGPRMKGLHPPSAVV